MLRWALIGLSATLSILLAIQHGQDRPELPLLLVVLLLGFGLVLFGVWPEDRLEFLPALYALSLTFGFAASLPQPEDAETRVLLVVCALLAVGMLVSAKFFFRRPAALLGLVLMPGLLAFYSSPQGSPGDLALRIAQWFGVSEAAGEAILIAGRKSVHFVFYGVMGVLAWRTFTKYPAILALAFVLLHGIFDEARQSSYATRTGSSWDVLIDLGGAVAFIALAKRLGWKPAIPSNQTGDRV